MSYRIVSLRAIEFFFAKTVASGVRIHSKLQEKRKKELFCPSLSLSLSLSLYLGRHLSGTRLCSENRRLLDFCQLRVSFSWTSGYAEHESNTNTIVSNA